jgi:P-type E1-E2 ATPase
MIKEQTTHLEHLLEKISGQIGKYAIVLTILSVVTHGLFTLAWILANDHIFLFSSEALLEGVKIGITAIVLLIVCIPEGLPLAVSIAMALSTNKMKKDNILIKNLESVQICAMLHDICVGKTGTLTEGTLDVARY